MGIDDISAEIGALKAEAKASQRQRAIIFKKLDNISNQIAELNGHMLRLADYAGDSKVKATKHEERIGSLERSRAKLIGMAAGSGGIIGAGVSWLAKHFPNGGS